MAKVTVKALDMVTAKPVIAETEVVTVMDLATVEDKETEELLLKAGVSI